LLRVPETDRQTAQQQAGRQRDRQLSGAEGNDTIAAMRVRHAGGDEGMTSNGVQRTTRRRQTAMTPDWRRERPLGGGVGNDSMNAAGNDQ
jgi:hypothetical protein